MRTDFNLFDADGKCVYRGQLDGSRPGNKVPVTGIDLRAALDHVINGEKVPEDQMLSIGCNIKWKQPVVHLENKGKKVVH